MGRQESVAVFNRNLLIVSLLICAAVGASQASLLPFIDRPANGLFGELWADPFRILEEVPFGLERDESLVVPAARVDWKETPEGHMIAIDVPGLKKDELKIELEENRVLRVSGERKREEEQKGDHWHRTERSYGKFWRQFRLPENVDLDTLNARLENGVLKLTMSKLTPDRIKGPRMVSIEEADHRDEAAKIKNVEAKQEL